MKINDWEKKQLTCECGRKFKPTYRNGILVSKLCPNCRYKKACEQSNSKKDNLYRFKGKVAKKGLKRGKTGRQKMMDKADKVFSQYIRVKFAIERGGELFCKDIITGRYYPVKRCDNGHYISRGYKATRFNENNCRPQNRSSNRFSGEADHYKFRENLIKEIGEEKVIEVEKLKDTVCRDHLDFYTEQFEKYTKLLDNMLKERGWNNPWKIKKV